MSSQYHTIATTYDAIRQLYPDRLERTIVEEEIKPYIPNARVLDLACGTGFYTQLLSQWGASSVVGVDQSRAMLDIARQRFATTYIEGDCASGQICEGGNFDLVFGGWLLNYAPDRRTLEAFFRTISRNLKEGGTFMGVVPHPTDDPKGFTDEAERIQPIQYGGVTMNVIKEVEHGIKSHLYAPTDPPVEFDFYHLRESIYRNAAREGGMRGELNWVRARKMGRLGFAGEEEWDWTDFLERPNFAILVVRKD